VKAQGKRVLSVPMWVWCDDTSGNQSKKWNKHNSFLVTFAGLPRHMQQSAFNIHFLATSNIASPLEMFEGIGEEIRYVLRKHGFTILLKKNRSAQTNGIEAWDCSLEEDVLLVPWIYGLPGDNPMQSEMCSHIGMTGNLFCRVCKVNRSKKEGAGADAIPISEEQHLRNMLSVSRI
jgi:hypothetical protein